MANEAYLVGGPRVQESYLNLEKIIEIAKKTNAEAIHPGYGLLSENPSFSGSLQRRRNRIYRSFRRNHYEDGK